jgi:hypothetical protein
MKYISLGKTSSHRVKFCGRKTVCCPVQLKFYIFLAPAKRVVWDMALPTSKNQCHKACFWSVSRELMAPSLFPECGQDVELWIIRLNLYGYYIRMFIMCYTSNIRSSLYAARLLSLGYGEVISKKSNKSVVYLYFKDGRHCVSGWLVILFGCLACLIEVPVWYELIDSDSVLKQMYIYNTFCCLKFVLFLFLYYCYFLWVAVWSISCSLECFSVWLVACGDIIISFNARYWNLWHILPCVFVWETPIKLVAIVRVDDIVMMSKKQVELISNFYRDLT